jgi:hypothetical protein
MREYLPNPAKPSNTTANTRLQSTLSRIGLTHKNQQHHTANEKQQRSNHRQQPLKPTTAKHNDIPQKQPKRTPSIRSRYREHANNRGKTEKTKQIHVRRPGNQCKSSTTQWRIAVKVAPSLPTAESAKRGTPCGFRCRFRRARANARDPRSTAS